MLILHIRSQILCTNYDRVLLFQASEKIMFGRAKIVVIFYYKLQDCGFLDATDSSKVISSHNVDFYFV